MSRSAEVVICTRNRARPLAGACEAILRQDYPGELWRLLIVDSASTDDTFELALALERKYPARVRALRTGQAGHSAARNAGVQQGSADIVAFTDDDALPDPCWLSGLVQVMDREGAQVGGGPVDLVLSGELPPWFLDDYLPYLAIWRPGAQTQRLRYNEYPRGVNIAFRREAFERYGLFSPHLGLRGEAQLYCEETEVCLRIERNGGAVVYSPSSRVRHCVDAGRFSPGSLSRRFAAQGRSEAIVNWMHGGLRGLLLGSRVHLAHVGAARWQSTLAGRPEAWSATAEVVGADPRVAARILTSCRRRALLGYLLEMPVAIANVPRYRPPAGANLPRWRPPVPRGAGPARPTEGKSEWESRPR